MNISLLAHQKKFLLSQSKFCLLRGGIGSGKTFIGAAWVVKKIKEEPSAPGLIVANTHKQLERATLATLFSFFDSIGMNYRYNQNKGLINANGSSITVNSLGNYQDLRGPEYGWGWMDEVRDTKQEAFEVLVGRMRHKESKTHEVRLTSSPRGFDWQYDYFEGEMKTKFHEMIHATSKDNPFLPEGYLESLEAQYDSKMFQQEIMAEIINLTSGAVYYAFDRKINVGTVKYNPEWPIMIGMDFNINPMTAVIAHIIDDQIHIFDEVWIQTSNTNEVAEYIKEKYNTGHRIIPDATGKALKTSSAGLSDHMILRNHGFNIPGVANPARVDRYSVVNNLLEKRRIIIDPKCRNLIRDLERVSYKEGTTLPDITDKSLTHISDALGYLSWYLFPLQKRKIKVSRYA